MELDKGTFEREIKAVDSKLALEKVSPAARPFEATIAMFQSHNVSGPLVHHREKNRGFPVTEMNLSDHVDAWYAEQYGNKIKIDPSPGQFPFLIEGAVYQCRLPLIIGRFTVLAAKGRFTDKSILNAVDYITDLTPHQRDRLSANAEADILAMFVTCYEVTSELRRWGSDLLTSGSSDINLSCDLLCGYKVSASLSAWHSLQFAEKCLKAYISQFEVPRHTHDIERLVGAAQRCGYIPDKRLHFGLFNFGASVRYNPGQIEVDQAVSINHESWRVAFNVLKQMQA